MKSILALAAFGLAATSANAAGVKNLCTKGQINEVECHNAKGRAGYAVEILNCKGEGTVANIYQPGPGDKPQLAKSQKIKQNAVDPHKMGAPQTYTGDNFKLSVNWTTAPGPGGSRAGGLEAKIGSTKVKEDLACMMTR